MKALFLAVFAILLLGCTQPNPPGVCTLDAMICPDGSAVGRVAPSCEFAPCPSASPTIAPTDVPDDIPPLPDGDTFSECKVDSDCAIGGCNSEICTTPQKAKDVASICVYKPEFACYKQIGCGCISGVCAWEETPEFRLCVQGAKQGGSDLPPLPQ
ncbi:MAG: eight-cysteine-cluster domain-containing protein [Candidatus Micrarchaeota archaeon]